MAGSAFPRSSPKRRGSSVGAGCVPSLTLASTLRDATDAKSGDTAHQVPVATVHI